MFVPCNPWVVFDFGLTKVSDCSLRHVCAHRGTAYTCVFVIASQWSVFHLSSRLSMLQGCVVPHRPNVWLCGHLHAVLQGEGDGHSA